MQIQVQRWGNSLAIRIPKSMAADTKIKQGSKVDLSLVKGKLVASPIVEQEYTLDALLAGVTNKNLHQEVDAGKAMGKEIWLRKNMYPIAAMSSGYASIHKQAMGRLVDGLRSSSLLSRIIAKSA